MRTSTRTPRMSWFQCFPVEFMTDPEFLAMSATARGVYWTLILYSWNALTQGDGLSADPRFLQQISGTTPLEWDTVQAQVLTLFKLKDGKLYLSWLQDAALDATEKVRKIKESADCATAARNAKTVSARAEKQNTNDPQIKTDDTDEIRLDKYGRPNGHSNERPNGQPPSTPSEFNGSTSSDSSSSVSPSVSPVVRKQDSGVPSVEPANDEPPDVGGGPKDLSPEVIQVRAKIAELGWKFPAVSRIQEFLETASVDDICDGMDEYDSHLNGQSNDSHYAEFHFFAERGGLIVIQKLQRDREDQQAAQRAYEARRGAKL